MVNYSWDKQKTQRFFVGNKQNVCVSKDIYKTWDLVLLCLCLHFLIINVPYPLRTIVYPLFMIHVQTHHLGLLLSIQ